MGHLDDGAWAESARSYATLRRRHWRCSGGMVAMGVVIISVGLAEGLLSGESRPNATEFLLIPTSLAFLGCWLGSVTAWIAIFGVRCPKCGKRFAVTWYASWPGDRCLHCGLDLGAIGRTAAKPAAIEDL